MANEIMVINDNDKALITAVLGGKMAQDIEFDQLDNAIEKITAHTEALSDGQRESASDVIDKFERRVVTTIETKAKALTDFEENLGISLASSYSEFKIALMQHGRQIAMLLEDRGLDELKDDLESIGAAIAEIDEYIELEEPQKPFIDLNNMTPVEVSKLRMQDAFERNKFESEVKKKEYRVRRQCYDFFKKLRKEKSIKEFCKLLEIQAKAAENANAVVREKAAAAQMAILIGDKDIREALKDFHDFATSIA